MQVSLPSRTSLLLLLGGLLCSAAFAQVPTRQQETLLRLSYGGNFLPERTAVVVLVDQDTTTRGATQPLFIPLATYPLQTALVLQQDTLNFEGRTSAEYATTRTSRNRYFIYARTPAGTLYWSYSALKDSLKFDTIESGVMSVAPVRDSTTAANIVSTFFSGPILPEDDTLVETPVLAEGDSAAVAEAPDESLLPSTEEPVTEGMSAASDLAGILLPNWLALVSGGMALLLLTGLLLLVFYYRSRIALLAPDADNNPVRFHPSDWHPDRRTALEDDLAELKEKHEQLQKTYNTLLARHKTLIREFQRLQQEVTAPAPAKKPQGASPSKPKPPTPAPQ